MNKSFFLGANSSEGFYSLYKHFPPNNGFLHIIKAGPGTGKSTFMRRIGKAAEDKGYDVEYILCSGDPASLDGVYITQLNEAWVDGTAPHITEPQLFGVNSDYVNLGKFLNKAFSGSESGKIKELNSNYKQQYVQAYDYLKAAAQLKKAVRYDLFGENGKNAISRRVNSILKRNIGHSSGKQGKAEYRFISAISCLGYYRLNCPVNELCKLKYQFDSSLQALPFALEHAAAEALRRGVDIIICPSPLIPDEIEAVLIPSKSLALLGRDWEFEDAKSVHIDNMADLKLLESCKAEIKESSKLEKKTMELACGKLQSAKALHDELEEIYKSHMDFSALNRFSDAYIKKLLQ